MHDEPTLDPRLLQLRIVVAALIAGVVVFALMTVFFHRAGSGFPTNSDPAFAHLLMMTLTGFGLALLVTGIAVGRIQIRKLRIARQFKAQETPAPDLLARFHSLTIVKAALAEGFAFFATVVFLLTTETAALVATGIGLLALIWMFPTAAAYHRFVAAVSGP